MKKNYLLLTLFTIASLFISCDPNDDSSTTTPDTTPFTENFGNEVTRDFFGQIVDINNIPVQNAAVKIGSSSVQTDINGVFHIDNAEVYQRLAYVTVTKSGFIDGSRSMVPTEGINNVKIMLIPSSPLQTISSGSTSEVALPSGTKVIFDGAFEDANGNSYSGDVSVSMYHLETSNPNIDLIMPGMLYGESATGEEAALQTFGMLNVELRGSNGQKLQIADGHQAGIEMIIDPSQLATAPQIMPLHHFDEANGHWKEQGAATKVGNKYVGEVSHFSWWNCDLLNPTLLITFNIVDNAGNPLPNTMIAVTPSTGGHAAGVTDSNGQLSGMLPANVTFTVNIFNATCAVWPSPITIGPFTVDTVVPNLVPENTNAYTTVSGNLLNCDNANVTNGYVLLMFETSTQVVSVTNGAFSSAILLCDATSEISIIGIDSDNILSTGQTTMAAAFPQTNFGAISACNNDPSFNLAGEYTVVVTRDDNGETHTFTTEMITLTGPNQYRTSSTGLYLPGDLATNDYGFNFITDGYDIIVPGQNLANYYSNQVAGHSTMDDGLIIDDSHFTIHYSIWFTNNTVERSFTAVYTRN